MRYRLGFVYNSVRERVSERGNGAYRIEHTVVSYRIVSYILHLVTPRSEGRGGTGPDTLYFDLANEVQRSNT